MNTTVNDSLLNRLKPFLAAHNKLTQRQDKIRLKSNRIIIIGIVHVDIHRVDVLTAGRTYLNNLTAKPFYQSTVL